MKVEADKVKIVPDPPRNNYVAPYNHYNSGTNHTAPNIHYTPARSIDPSAFSNTSDQASLVKEDVKIAMMEAVVRSLRTEFRLPEKLVVGRHEYDLTRAFRDESKDGYISLTAWQTPGILRIVNMKFKATSFSMNRNDKVQSLLFGEIDKAMTTAAIFPSTLTIDGTTYRSNVSYVASCVMPPKEGWLHLTVDVNFTPVASVHLVENTTIVAS